MLTPLSVFPAHVFTTQGDSVRGRWITFERTGLSASGKTEIWMVRDADGRAIATVRFYAPWRQYVFEPGRCTVYEPQCLREITVFLETLKAHRAQARRALSSVVNPQPTPEATHG